jgi:hypothetical protein
MDRFDQDRLTAALESLRPTPTPTFAAELDERAAAGFPRRRSGAVSSSPRRRFGAWTKSLRPRRFLIPAGATALAAIVAVTVVLAVGENGGIGEDAGSTGGGGSTLGFLNKLPEGTEFSSPVPSTEAIPSKSAAGSTTAGTEPRAQSGPYAAGAGRREVERSAEMVLGADADEVAGDAAKVFDAVHAYDGIVLSSSVNGGVAGHASAEFDLLIPSAKLGDALAAFSAIAEVRSRHEATDDITAPTIRVGERLQDARATIDGLLVQLAGADSDTERAAVEAELASERRHAAALRSSLAKLDRRANLSRVSLRIESDGSSGSSGSGAWGADDALGDAGHILGIAAGVTVVGLAILAPLALIFLLAWLGARAWRRRSRERALD